MQLSVQDRILLNSVLPQQGSFDKLIIRRDILEKTEFSQEELTEYGIVTAGHQVSWEKDTLKEFRFTKPEVNYASECLKDLSSKNNLLAHHLGLYDIFVNGVENPKIKIQAEAEAAEAASPKKEEEKPEGEEVPTDA